MAVDNIARGMAAKALENQGGGGSSLPIANTATVGQTIKVAAVDGDGKPTEWEAGNVSWNDLEDKPFYKEENNRTWQYNGNESDYTIIEANVMGQMVCKYALVEPGVTTLDGFLGGTLRMTASANGQRVEQVLPIEKGEGLLHDSHYEGFGPYMLIAVKGDIPAGKTSLFPEGMTAEPGVYAIITGPFTLEEMAISWVETVVHPLDSAFIPTLSNDPIFFDFVMADDRSLTPPSVWPTLDECNQKIEDSAGRYNPFVMRITTLDGEKTYAPCIYHSGGGNGVDIFFLYVDVERSNKSHRLYRVSYVRMGDGSVQSYSDDLGYITLSNA